MIRHSVPDRIRNEELSVYLKRAWPMLPGHVLRDLLKKKDVRVNGVKSGKGTAVHGGDILEIYADTRYFETAAEVVFDDGKLIAAVKPQGLPSLPDRDGIGEDTMEKRIQRIHDGARLCHRLDAGTGGIMLAAADDETYDQAFETFKQHRINKTYCALLLKRPPRDNMLLKAYLIKDARHSEVQIVSSPRNNAKEIITRVRVLRTTDRGLVRVELEPVTGRTHQLRAHMASIGCPILGDDKYGDREQNKQLGYVGKLCLWCETIELPKDALLKNYAGVSFHADAPEWR